ncbi:MAG: bifunctional nuclease family protein [Firmicutes bacterium]|nr:bifunctional nuclease family protein [Bacillota bacterium]
MLEVKVGYVGVHRETGHPLVLLSDLEELRYLPIVIGAYEAGAILASLEGHSFSRPLTHDLLLNTINSLQGRLLQVVISTIESGAFHALLYVSSPSGVVEIDSRASDAIALALRAGVSIYVTEEVASRAMIPATRVESVEDVDEEKEEFLRFLEDVRPEDFRSSLEQD